MKNHTGGNITVEGKIWWEGGRKEEREGEGGGVVEGEGGKGGPEFLPSYTRGGM
jgi:hypothetical protein